MFVGLSVLVCDLVVCLFWVFVICVCVVESGVGWGYIETHYGLLD